MDRDRPKVPLLELLKAAGNGRCADCGAPGGDGGLGTARGDRGRRRGTGSRPRHPGGLWKRGPGAARPQSPCGVASRERSPRRPGRRRAAAARCDKGEARRAAGEGNDRAGWSPPSTSGLLPALRGWRERVPGRGRPGGCELCTRGAAPRLKRRSALRSAAELPTMNF